MTTEVIVPCFLLVLLVSMTGESFSFSHDLTSKDKNNYGPLTAEHSIMICNIALLTT